MTTVVEQFKGLADPTRLRIINLLTGGALCGCDIQHVLQLSQPNVSRHLMYLKRSGLVTDARDGYRVFYRLTDGPGPEHTALHAYLRQVFGREKSFTQDKRRLAQAVKDGACTVSVRPSSLSGKRRR